MTTDLRIIKAQLDEIMGTEAYQWLMGEITKDANSVLQCLANEPDYGVMRYRQGEIYGMNLVLAMMSEPWKRLDKAAERAATK